MLTLALHVLYSASYWQLRILAVILEAIENYQLSCLNLRLLRHLFDFLPMTVMASDFARLSGSHILACADLDFITLDSCGIRAREAPSSL